MTDAIRTAVFAEMADVGYARMSMDAIAKRAGVGKAAIYRRFASKEAMVLSLIEEVAAEPDGIEDTGSLRGDVLAWLRAGGPATMVPFAATVIPDLLAEAARNPTFSAGLHEHVAAPRRRRGRELFERACARGELPAGVDLGIAADLLAGPLYWRSVATEEPAGDEYLGRLADAIVAGVRATARG